MTHSIADFESLMAAFKYKKVKAAERKVKRLAKRVKKPSRKALVKKLDTLFSLYIRMRDKKLLGGICPFACNKPLECCFHFVTRAKHSVRWDESNAVGGCHGHNYRYEFDPHFAIRWYIDRYGEPAYADLILKGNQIAKFSNADLQDKIDFYKAKVEGGV